MSKEKMRVNLHLSPADGYLYEAILKANPMEKSDTLRRLAQAGALLERMIGAGLGGEVIGGVSKQGGRAKDRETPISLQSSKSGKANENGRNAREEVKPAEPKQERDIKAESGFGDLPLDDQFLQ